jgi:hypothetical protein
MTGGAAQGGGDWMFGWFKKRSPSLLASAEERETILSKFHPVFRVIDTDFHIFLEVVVANPTWDDNQIAQALCARGVEPDSAQNLVSFAPLAFGRETVGQAVAGLSVSWVHTMDLSRDSE